jgi:hypothetical protein
MARKTGYEAKVERTTWFALMLAFLFLTYGQVTGTWVCFAISAILMISGIYQYTKKWRISPLTWIVAALAAVAGGYGIYYNPVVDLSLVALGLIVLIIAWGVVTNEG